MFHLSNRFNPDLLLQCKTLFFSKIFFKANNHFAIMPQNFVLLAKYWFMLSVDFVKREMWKVKY